MNPIIFKLIKILFFFIAAYLSALLLLRALNRNEKKFSITDPEIITAAILSGAVLTMAASLTLKVVFS
jgi:hypothetical protein